ncbi:hypothetical protein JCM11491_001777 [Sporobolomyces phaffii]
MITRNAIASIARRSSVLARSSPTSLVRIDSLRLASSVAAADLPRAPPHDKIPFSAPPKDETKGDLGQVDLPDMTERTVEHALKIPSEPDAYRASEPASESGGSFPSLQRAAADKLHTVAHPSTHPNGGPSLAATSADDTFEGFQGDHTLSASAAKDGVQPTSKGDRDGAGRQHGHRSRDDGSKDGEGEQQAWSQEDNVGLLKLGGIVVVGWVLGGLTRPYKPQHTEKHDHEVKV